MSRFCTNQKQQIIEDEICLEGLDGITLQALWVRLSYFDEFSGDKLLTDEVLKSVLWYITSQIPIIDCYELLEPRPDLKVFNRYDYVEEEFGTIVEQEEQPDVYPVHLIDDGQIRGSCSTYRTRKLVTSVRSLPYKEVTQQYGNRLVLVAKQRCRNRALGIDERMDPYCDTLAAKSYIMLERIGRSRSQGELSHGKNSLSIMEETPKSLFYIRKRLLQLNLITKQVHRQRSLRGVLNVASLFHIARFYVQRKTKLVIMIESIVKAIRESDGFMLPFVKVKEILNVPTKLRKKLFESTEFLRFIQTVMVPYRELHPDYVENVRTKGERTVKYFTLTDRNITTDDVAKPTEDDAVGDDNELYPGYLNVDNQAKVAKALSMGVSPVIYAYKLAKEAGSDGISQLELSSAMGISKLDARSVCRMAMSKKLFCSIMKDTGRQRVSRYVTPTHYAEGSLGAEYNTARDKMLSLIDTKPGLKLMSSEVFVKCDTESAIATSEPADAGTSTSPVVKTDKFEDLLAQPSTSRQLPMANDTTISIDASIQSEILEQPPIGVVEAKMSFLENGPSDNPAFTTARVLKRASIILDMVKRKKVIDDCSQFSKVILKAEQEEGVTVKMDKKSLNRIIKRLINSEMIRPIRVQLNGNSISKVMNYLVDPSITSASPEFLASIECNKQMFLLKSFCQDGGSLKKREPLSSVDTVLLPEMDKLLVEESVEELKKMNDKLNATNVIKKATVNKGVGSKFVRMRELHHMLFYLLYDYSGSAELDQEAAWDSINRIHGFSPEQKHLYPRFFSMEQSWKMFVPPLPKHVSSTTAGWVFVVDILLRLPLCLFVCIVNVASYEVELQPYLSHPIKKFLLVKDLPPDIRHMILRGRKYVTYVMELLQRLCQIGLIQFGNQVLKEKDHVFVYINRKSLLVDTTTTRPSYYQIATDMEYISDGYYFATLQNVITYWLDMETICLHTPLGCHSTREGKCIAFDHIAKRPDFSPYMTAQSLDGAPARDNGYIPGDGLGAAGMDSSLYAHLRRNWCLKTNKYYSGCQISLHGKQAPGQQSDTSSSLYVRYLKNTAAGQPYKGDSKSRLTNMKKFKLNLYKPKTESPIPIQPKTESVAKKKTKKVKSNSRKKNTGMVRYIKNARKKGPPRKPYYDDLDREALRRMEKLRVDWSNEEDSLLLMCRVASMKLFPNRRGQVSFIVVRDLLHARIPASLNKTSRACQRRVNYMLKDKAAERNMAIFLEEILRDPSIRKDFKPLKINPRIDNITPEIKAEFMSLVERIIEKFKSPNSNELRKLPDSYKELQKQCNLYTSTSLKTNVPVYAVQSIQDIEYYVVYSLMFSCLCTLQDRESWGYQLYLAYQKYPQRLLEKVLTAIRLSKMTSFKKHCSRSQPKKCLPLTTSPYQLSVAFVYLFNQRYQFDVFSDCWQMLKDLVHSKEQSFQVLTESTVQVEQSQDGYVSEDLFPSPEKAGRKRKKPQLSTRPSKVTKLDSKDLIISQSGMVSDELEEIVMTMENIEVEEQRVDMSQQNLGGHAAAVISLMTSNRISFEVIVPDEIFVLKNDSDDESNSPVNILETNAEGNTVRKSPTSDFNVLQATAIETDMEIDEMNKLDVAPHTAVVDGATSATTDDFSSTAVINDPLTSITGSPWTTAITHPSRTVVQDQSSPTTKDQFVTDVAMTTTQEDPLSTVEEDETAVILPNEIPEGAEDGTNLIDIECLPKDILTTFDDISFCHSPVNPPTLATTSRSRASMHLMRSSAQRGYHLGQEEIERSNVEVQSCGIKVALQLPSTLDTVPVISSKDIAHFYLPCHQDLMKKALSKREKVLIVEQKNVEGIWSQDLIEEADTVLSFITSFKDIGVTAEILKGEFKNKLSRPVMKVLRYMEESNFVWRMGVLTPRWVSHKYATHWLIHTNKIPRHQTKSEDKFRVQGVYEINSNAETTVSEANNSDAGPSKDTESSSAEGLEEMVSDIRDADEVSGVETNEVIDHKANEGIGREAEEVIDHEAKDPIVCVENEEVIDSESDKSKCWEQDNQSSEAGQENSEDELEPKPKRPCLRTSARQQNKSEEVCSTEMVDESLTSHILPARAIINKKHRSSSSFSRSLMREKERQICKTQQEIQYEAIDVAVRPWARLNGSLNRRVMDRFLGAILTYVMENPGATGKKISMRFWPALIPAHTYELLETLLDLECVGRFRIESTQPAIFSEETELFDKGDVADYDFDEDFAYEPKPDALVRHAMFIGDKTYTTDFLKYCR